jgi:alpha-tubulin suppressor-like RCC1 family protein
MPNQFFSPEGDLENYFVTEYWLIDQYVGDELWVWGNAANGRLGNASTVTAGTSTPVTTFSGGVTWEQVAATSFSVAIKTDGTLWTWGDNANGRLGNAVTVGRSTPVTTFLGGTNWKQAESGNAFGLAIKTDGTLWTWGDNTNGNLGNASTVETSTPVTTFLGGTNWKQMSAGGTFLGSTGSVAAIKTDGTLWTWGPNSNGRLGNAATATTVSTPVTTFLGGTNWKQVSVGESHMAAIKTDGTLWTWGNAANGRLGNASTVGTSTPVTTFLGGTNWKSVSVSDTNTAAIKTDGTLWIWGSATNGQLGNAATTGNISTPVTTFLGGTNWKQISCGDFSSSAIKTDGTLWTWGDNANGRLGNAVTVGRSTPVTTFVGGKNWKQTYAGASHVLAVRSGLNAEVV